jgi:AraC-like DNA-binding protein
VYRERASRIAGAVVWERRADREARVLPDGCMDLIWSAGGLLVAGPDTEAHLAGGTGGWTVTGLRLAPGTGPAVLGVPAHALRDLRVPLDAVWAPAVARPVADRVASAGAVGPVLEAVAAARLREAGGPDPLLAAVATLLGSGAAVTAVAREVGLSERQLRRRSLVAFGYGPKTLARVLRMQRALDLARAAVPFADTAARAGYADQPHLAREVRRLAGVPLRELVRERAGARTG